MDDQLNYDGDLAEGGLARFLKEAERACLYGSIDVSGEWPGTLVLASGRVVVPTAVGDDPRNSLVEHVQALLTNSAGRYHCRPLVDIPSVDRMDSIPISRVLMDAMIRRVAGGRVPDQRLADGRSGSAAVGAGPVAPSQPGAATRPVAGARPGVVAVDEAALAARAERAARLRASFRKRPTDGTGSALPAAPSPAAGSAGSWPGAAGGTDAAAMAPPPRPPTAEQARPASRRRALRNLIWTLTS